MVCACNVDMLVQSYRDQSFRRQLSDADLVLPDGVPLVWLLRRSGIAGAERVAGPDLMLDVCAAAATSGIPIGFYGGREEVVAACAASLLDRFPGLEISLRISPPYRTLTSDEDDEIRQLIVGSGVRILFVALGCPKQERWIHRHRDLPVVMLGVGAAVDFHAGSVRRAPLWMQRNGLEWLFRLGMEPRRLWRRYLVGNSLFLALVATEAAQRSTWAALRSRRG